MADRVTVIGWDGSPLTAAARSALGAATLVAGAAHHLALPEVPPTAERIRLGSVALAARRIAGHRGTAVVLADGDPGFFGVVRTLRAPEFGLEVEVVPAVSSVAAAFARAGMPWDDAQVVVAHRRTLRRAVNVCRAHTKVAVLTSPGAGPAELGLLLEGVHRTFVICEELGTEREQVTVVTSDKAADHIWRDPNVVIVIGGPAGRPSRTGRRLDRRPRPGRRRRAAGRCPPRPTADRSARARRTCSARPNSPASDRASATSCGTSAAAAAPSPPRPPAPAPPSSPSTATSRPAPAPMPPPAASASSCRSSTARAPHVLENLPEPDVVRVGGGGAAVVSAVADRRPQRIVTHAATRDEAELVGRDLTEHGYHVECALLQSVELDTRAWTETERSVAFLLSGRSRVPERVS